MARMHWFWRAAIGTAAGWLYGVLSLTAFEGWHERLLLLIVDYLGGNRHGWRLGISGALVYFLPALLLAFCLYGLLTWRFGPKAAPDFETRCRKCGYILRGLAEPRCPECGERV